MSQRKPAIYPDDRLAYREAGHATVACYYEIPVTQVGLSKTSPTTSISVYSRIEEYCHLTPGEPADLRTVDQYIVFLLAGTIADLLHSEHYYEIYHKTSRQRHFRARWYAAAWENPDYKLDQVYWAIAAWLPTHWPFRIDKEQLRFWKRTIGLLEEPKMWQGVEKTFYRLRDGEILDNEDVRDLLIEFNE